MNRFVVICLAIAVIIGVFWYKQSQTVSANVVENDEGIYPYAMTSIDGKPLDMTQFKGKVVLIVNVASKCGFTSQYKELETLYDTYKNKGFVVLGVPANNFKQQEPGTNKEIQEFCSLTYQVTFPMSEKVSVKGENIHPLYLYLTSQTSNKKVRGDISWNFNKFLINKDGKVVERYSSFTSPMSSRVTKKIEELLKK